jgi:uncharacterized protein (DUF1778 family)
MGYIRHVTSMKIDIPEDRLWDIDRAARACGESRNSFVLQACREALADEVRQRAEAGREPEAAVLAHRRNRGTAAS